MIKLSAMYPTGDGATFDMDYYVNRHVPMVLARLGAACKGGSVDAGLGGFVPGTPAPYLAVGHLLFDSVEALQAAWMPHNDEIMGDIPNYTNVAPLVQLSEVKF